MNSHRSFARCHVATLAMLLLVSFGVASGQQTKRPTSTQTRKASHSDQQRADAIASLRAIGSALDAGATIDDFKKYQIESRVKVDALPETARNRDIRAISDIYNVSLMFSRISIRGILSQDDIKLAQSAGVAADVDLSEPLAHLKPGDLDVQLGSAGPLASIDLEYAIKGNKLWAEELSHLLMAGAKHKVKALK